MLHGLPRRSTAIAAGALLLSGALSSCGFDYATNEVNTISSSINNQEGAIDVLGAAIISGAPDSGLLVATLSNTGKTGERAPDGPDALVELGGQVTPAEPIEAVEINPLSIDNLYQRGGIPVSGTLELGAFVTVVMTFDSGQVTTLQVPVVRPCDEYDPAKFPDMVLPGPEPLETEVDTEAESETGVDTTRLTDAYSCEAIVPEPFHGGEEGEEGADEEAAE